MKFWWNWLINKVCKERVDQEIDRIVTIKKIEIREEIGDITKRENNKIMIMMMEMEMVIDI